jgi:hypothetical protein
MAIVLRDLDARLKKAVSTYWRTLARQSKNQKKKGAANDPGGRAAATGGKQMDGFADLVKRILIENGMPGAYIHLEKQLELPGFFRPTKKWDIVVVKDGILVAAIELKSQIGPSFGNNLNNRSEEAVGTAQDLRTAFREGKFNTRGKPWVGTMMLVEDCPKSQSPVQVKEPHFEVFPEFKGSSYAKRYELLMRKLVLEELYTRAALLLSTKAGGKRGQFTEPADDLTARNFFASLAGHVGTILASQS